MKLILRSAETYNRKNCIIQIVIVVDHFLHVNCEEKNQVVTVTCICP